MFQSKQLLQANTLTVTNHKYSLVHYYGLVRFLSCPEYVLSWILTENDKKIQKISTLFLRHSCVLAGVN